MERVYKDEDEVVERMKAEPLFDSNGGLIGFDVYLDGKYLGCINDYTKELKTVVTIHEEGKYRTRLTFDVRKGLLTVDLGDPGEASYTVPATSGIDRWLNTPMNNPAYECDKNIGPIPRGTYILYISKLDNPYFMTDYARTKLRADWGDWRVRLHPADEETKKKCDGKRNNFFLHGGESPGSAGCIDIGGGIFGNATTDRVLKDLLSDSDGKVTMIVQ